MDDAHQLARRVTDDDLVSGSSRHGLQSSTDITRAATIPSVHASKSPRQQIKLIQDAIEIRRHDARSISRSSRHACIVVHEPYQCQLQHLLIPPL
jgi:hypothetical protein